jgi:hypothetical protein
MKRILESRVLGRILNLKESNDRLKKIKKLDVS